MNVVGPTDSVYSNETYFDKALRNSNYIAAVQEDV